MRNEGRSLISKVIVIFLLLALFLMGGVNWYVLALLLQTYPDIAQIRHVTFWSGVAIWIFIGVFIALLVGAAIGHFLRFLFTGKGAVLSFLILIGLGAIGVMDLIITRRLDGLEQVVAQNESDGNETRLEQVSEAIMYAAISAIVGTILLIIGILYFMIRLFASAAKKKKYNKLDSKYGG